VIYHGGIWLSTAALTHRYRESALPEFYRPAPRSQFRAGFDPAEKFSGRAIYAGRQRRRSAHGSSRYWNTVRNREISQHARSLGSRLHARCGFVPGNITTPWAMPACPFFAKTEAFTANCVCASAGLALVFEPRSQHASGVQKAWLLARRESTRVDMTLSGQGKDFKQASPSASKTFREVLVHFSFCRGSEDHPASAAPARTLRSRR